MPRRHIKSPRIQCNQRRNGEQMIYQKKNADFFKANFLLLGYVNQSEYNEPDVGDKLWKQERDNNPPGSLTKWWDNTKLHQIKRLEMYAKA
jgi:hypothetical protein